jgi:dienelactone hydrolase
MTRVAIGTSDERPVFFPAAGETLFGIHTWPPGDRLGVGVILLAVRATYYRNRVAVRLARQLAADGFDVLRFDYHGVGESTGSSVFDLDRPFVDDLLGAVRWAREQGLRRLVVLGQCFGARTALAAASQIEELAGMVCVAMPFRHDAAQAIEKLALPDYARRALQPSNWMRLREAEFRSNVRDAGRALLGRLLRRGRRANGASPRFPVHPALKLRLEHVIDRKLPLLFLYGADDPSYQEFLLARQDALRDLFARASSVEVAASIPGELHAFRDVSAQELFLSTARRWIFDLGTPGRPYGR